MERGGARGGRGGGGGRGGRGGNISGGSSSKLGDDEYTSGNLVEGPSGAELSLDRDVMEKENLVVDENQGLSLESLNISGFRLPLRPAFGAAGRKIVLKTNYFRMHIDTSKPIFRYEVNVKSDRKKRQGGQGQNQDQVVSGGRITRVAFGLLFETPDFKSLGHGIATDYSKTILTTTKLNLGPDGSKAYSVQYREAEETTPRRVAIIYTFTLSLVGTVPTTELKRYLESTTSNPSDCSGRDEAIQALNIIVAKTPNFNPLVFQAGQNKFFHYPQKSQNYLDLSGGLIAVRGYYSSVRTSTMRTLLNLNAQCSPFYPAINMWALIDKYCRWDPSQWEALEKFIEKLRVKTTYLKTAGKVDVRVKTVVGLSHKLEDRTNPKTREVKRVGNAIGDHGNAQQITFPCDEFPNESPISVEKFFLKKHNQKLEKPTAWVLNCGSVKDPVWIPSELCQIMPGQPYRGRLSDIQTTNMLTIASRPPAENARRIIGSGQNVIGFGAQNPTLDAFGVQIGKDMILVASRILEPPSVMYKKAEVKTAGGSWNMINKTFAQPGKLDCWAVLTLGAATFSPDHLSLFKNSLKNAGMTEQGFIRPQGSGDSYYADLPGLEQQNDTSIMNAIRTLHTDKVRTVFVILPSSNAVTYARIKYWSDIVGGINCVCAIGSKLSKGAQYFANIALKINLKCGGLNQLLPSKKLGFLAEGKTMVVGIDVTHPAPKSMEGTPSIAGVVASVDGNYGQWPGDIRCQESRKEMVTDLDVMMRRRLDLFKRTNGRLPEIILVYRDGVSEGQYRALIVSENDKNEKFRVSELDGIRKACDIYGDSPRPKITIIVVGKRHHTRFYPTQEKDADMTKKGNPQSGTVVDRGIVMERGFDFYLQAHSCLQGTAKPAHYVVVYDEMKLGADEAQGITHNLCYLYGRATKAVSIVPPAYYADILCERGRCYLQKYLNARWPPGKVFDPNEAPWYQGGVHQNLKETMFYI